MKARLVSAARGVAATLGRSVQRSAVGRWLSAEAVRAFVDAENVAQLASWPFPAKDEGVPVALSICVVAGVHRVVFVRSILALLDGLPSCVEILVANHGVATHAKRMLGDFPAVRYVEAPGAAPATIGRSMNALTAQARGTHVLLLMPDTVASRHAVTRALEWTRGSPSPLVACTGLLFDHEGRVVEAGGAEAFRVSASTSPSAGHEHVHPSTGASRAALLIDRLELASVGGLDERLVHTTLDEICHRLRARGSELLFDPRLAVIDVSLNHTADVQQRVRERDQLSSVGEVSVANPATRPLRVLIIEDRVPHPELGQGYPRSYRLIEMLDEAGHAITLYPRQEPAESTPSIYRDIPRRIEVLRGLGTGGMRGFLAAHAATYDFIIVARPDNMRVFREAIDAMPVVAATLPPVLYDAEALGALREIRRNEVLGHPLSPERAGELIGREVALAANCRLVVAVSEGERVQFERHGIRRVVTLGHAVDLRPTSAPFGARKDFLFVGALLGVDTPNSDGMRWFVEAVWPLLRQRSAARLLVAGPISDDMRVALANDAVDILGVVDDLQPLYARVRVFVAPTRFSAGIPLKVLEAASYGVPVVATPSNAEQLRWTAGVELFTGSDAAEFAERCASLHEDATSWEETRANALRAVGAQASSAVFRRAVDDLVRAAMAEEAHDVAA